MQDNERIDLDSFGASRSVQMLRADRLVVYPEVQRPAPTKKLVQDIANEFNENALGVLSVSERKDGSYSLVDGQRRVAALKMMGRGHEKVVCMVFTGMDVAAEAGLFRYLNKQRLVGSFDFFDKGVTNGAPDCLLIDKVVRSIGWAVSRTRLDGTICCVHALRKVFNMDKTGELLHKSIGALSETWGRNSQTMAGALIVGMAQFFASRKDVDAKTLVDKLKASYKTSSGLLTAARARHGFEGGSIASNVEALIDRCYSTRKKLV